MRLALLAFLAVGCVSQDGRRSPLLPTEFHLFGSRSWADSSGTLYGMNDPWRWKTDGDSDGYSIGAGFTWAIGPTPTDPAMRDLVRELRAERVRRLEPGVPIRVDLPVAITVQPVPAEDPPDAGGPDGTPDPDHVHEPGQGPSGPVPVVLEGAKDDVWVRLIGALALLATAVAGWVGRHRIPYVKHYTKRGRAARSELELEDDEPGE